jgi:hypothetical protein
VLFRGNDDQAIIQSSEENQEIISEQIQKKRQTSGNLSPPGFRKREQSDYLEVSFRDVWDIGRTSREE